MRRLRTTGFNYDEYRGVAELLLLFQKNINIKNPEMPKDIYKQLVQVAVIAKKAIEEAGKKNNSSNTTDTKDTFKACNRHNACKNRIKYNDSSGRETTGEAPLGKPADKYPTR